MNNIKKDGNTLLPTGYNQWRKDIENLIDSKRLRVYTLPFIVKVLTFAP